MTILLGLIKLLSSAGFGTIFGGIMGLLNRKVDIAVEKLKLEEAHKQRAHELAMRDKDAEIIEREFAARAKVAQIEGDASVEREGYAAMTKSYDFARPEKSSWTAAFSAFIRPFISLGYFLVTSYGCWWILHYAFHVQKMTLTNEQLFELVMYVIAWIAFMGGATIGWWYAMRPGKAPPTLKIGA